jgi:HAD superfamily hydrolase (TIGR01509 family)
MKTGFIFDMDGVLLDSMAVWDKTGEWYLEDKGLTPEPNLSQTLFSMSMKEGAVYLKAHYSLEETVEEIIAGINQTIEDFYYHQAKLKPYVFEFLQKAHKEEIPMVIATSTDKKLALAALKRLGILPFFQKVLSCSEFKEGKSNPEIFLAAKEILSTEIRNTWVVEDSLYASKTAKHAGFLVIGVYDPFSKQNEDALRKVCDEYIYDFSELAERNLYGKSSK